MEFTCHGRTLKLVTGDIGVQTVDAIVNAANSRLAGAGASMGRSVGLAKAKSWPRPGAAIPRVVPQDRQ
jgi:O-acetyl-ADP-ribose deacetylase (regulator of RNase III)